MTRRRKKSTVRKKSGPKPRFGATATVVRTLKLTPEQAARHDEARGEHTWADWIRDAAERSIAERRVGDGGITRCGDWLHRHDPLGRIADSRRLCGPCANSWEPGAEEPRGCGEVLERIDHWEPRHHAEPDVIDQHRE